MTTATALFTAEDVFTFLRSLDPDASNPKFVNEFGHEAGCRYRNDDDTPSCIIARLLTHLGVELPPQGDNPNARELFSRTDYADLFDPKTEELLQMIQERADYGNTWGDALDFVLGAQQ
ncbi:MAG: hypothetical protein ACXVGB_00190 [Mycobacteriaceae bacterium]